MRESGAKQAHAADSGERVAGRTGRRIRGFVQPLAMPLLLSAGLLNATCGGDSSSTPSTPSTPAPPPAPANRAPIVTQQVESLSLSRAAFSIDAARHFSDPDGDRLSFSATSSDERIISVGISGSELTLTPQSDGVATVTLTARDPGGLSESLSFQVTVEDDHGDTQETATLVKIPSITGGNIEDGNDRDYFHFRLDSRSMLVVRTTGSTVTYGELSGPNGLEREGGGSAVRPNFQITVDNAPPGDYYMVVAGWRSTGAYKLDLAAELRPPDDHGDTVGTATLVDVPSSTRGSLKPAGDLDFFRFHLDAPRRLTVQTTGGTDTEGTLRGPDGLRAYNNDSFRLGSDFRIVVAEAPAGEYTVRVEGFVSQTGSYELQVATEPIYLDNHGDTAETATRIDVPSITDGGLDHNGDLDYFYFRLAASRRRLIIYTTGEANTHGTLSGPDGLQRTNDNDREGFRIVVDAAPAGDYYLAVRVGPTLFVGQEKIGPYRLHVRVED